MHHREGEWRAAGPTGTSVERGNGKCHGLMAVPPPAPGCHPIADAGNKVGRVASQFEHIQRHGAWKIEGVAA